ncbi:flavin-containing monooxygenase [Gordonia rhizosphera]|uniref:Putative steroid monooxygenase n=1 Tax=Gordonia rhizosphera NBRC 16068 TaxID=1108045 RepID=K6W9C9_9ACTN|nr:NAD(P)/FAD-dependent oxidoreductase [Gordonia rhizosphera]GAB88792.1 putative steroid monooxygenase [Gordonia rhizosphera NBRC 16068]
MDIASSPTSSTSTDVDVAVVGAGFAGLYLLHRLRGQGLSVRVFEAGSGVGGTWFWNRYPGARCDIESVDYQYSFDDDLIRDWQWSERYPRQEELLAYLNHVADRFELRRDISLNTRVTASIFDDVAQTWTVTTDQNERISARFVILATGCLTAARTPDFDGLDDFAGQWYHTARWPDGGVDFTGKRVGIIGTGSSGIQSIPVIADQAEALTVFQRTANYSVPAGNHVLSDSERKDGADGFDARRRMQKESFLGMSVPMVEAAAADMPSEERDAILEERWQMGGLPMYGAFADVLTDESSNNAAKEFFAKKIRAKVDDPDVAERLIPKGYPFGGKRICVDTNYFETFNRDNVTLVDVNESPIERITANGIKAGDTEYELDAIVFATGFDAFTGALSAIDIRGRNGQALTEKWQDGPRNLLGLAMSGFPNMFLITGPGSPSVFSNMVVSIEQHSDWIADAIAHMQDTDARIIEATDTAEDEWVAHVNEVADSTLLPQANSWYNGANVPGKPRIFMAYLGGVGDYRLHCDEVARAGYKGFALTR